MGTNVRQGTVTNGLVLHLDAANIKSYPRTDTTWTDMSGTGISGSTAYTVFPTYTTDYAGGLFFNNQGQSAATSRGITLSQDNLRFGTGNYTMEIALTVSASLSSGYQPIIATGNNLTSGATGSYMGIFIRGTTGFINMLNDGGNLSTNISYTNNQPLIITFTKQSSTLVTYVNGSSIGSSVSATAYNTTETNGTTIIGTLRSPTWISQAPFFGTIYSIRAYNRALSPQEVAQNYNALKPRFGLS